MTTFTKLPKNSSGTSSAFQYAVNAFGAKILIIHGRENLRQGGEPRGHAKLEAEADIILLVDASNSKSISILKNMTGEGLQRPDLSHLQTTLANGLQTGINSN